MRFPFQLPWRSVGFFWVMTLLLNACLMTVEITAGRLLAPFVGVSVIVWASVIGVVMLAMSLGFLCGGWCSRQAFIERWFFLVLFGALVGLIACEPSARFFGMQVASLPLPLFVQSLLLVTVVLFLPVFFLAATQPILIRLATPDKEHAGRVVGVLGMATALGSILGTFLTGFVWLMWVSVPVILWVMSGVLLILLPASIVVFRFSSCIHSNAFSPPPREGAQTRSVMFSVYACLAFVSGFVFMAIEVAAGRALAPALGTSIFTWTGVIGAILLGITFGNTVGGLLADREGSWTLLGRTFAWSGIAVLVSVYVVVMAGSLFAGIGMPLAVRAILFALMAFLPPAFAIGMISPQLTKLALEDARQIGSVAGVLTAANTVGCLLGALLTGFVLISAVGVRGLFLLMAVALTCTGIVLLQGRSPWNRRLSFLLVLLFLLPVGFPRACDRETQYYCLQILKDVGYTPQSPAYVLRLDHLVHSYVKMNHPEALGYGYEQVYAHLLHAFEQPASPFSALFIGGGGYVLPKYIEKNYPAARVVVSEIDPEVTEANHARLGLSRSTKIETRSLDARLYLARQAEGESFDFVFGDAFNDFSVPYHLTTVEFHRLLKSRMSLEGVYALNIIDDPRYGQFLSAMVRTLRSVWAHVYVAPGAATFRPGRNTIVLIASDRALDPLTWRAGMSMAARVTGMDGEEYARLTQLMSEDKVEAFLQGHPVPTLTDAFVPTDRYLAPVFSDAY